MNKTATIPDKLRFGEETASNDQEKCELFHRYFQSVYYLHFSARFKVLNPKHHQEPTITIFFTAKKSIRLFLENEDITKFKGPEGKPHVFFQKLSEAMSHALHLIVQAIKRTKAIPD